MDIQVVLEASAIATIVGAGISYFTFRKTSRLTYITQERKEWRTEIRNIAEELERYSYNERQQVLAKLKTRINAYGENNSSGSQSCQADFHIWEKIEQIEKCKSKEEYERLREQLIYFLSLLLKDDWERSKKEVNGEPGQILAWGLFVLTFVLLGVGFFELGMLGTEWNPKMMVNNILTIASHLMIVFLVLLVFYFVGQSQKKFVYDFKISDFILQNNMWLMLGILGCALMGIKSNDYINLAGCTAFLSSATRVLIEFDQFLYRRMYKGVVEKARKNFEAEKFVDERMKS